MKKSFTLNLVLCAFFIAVGIILPFITGNIPTIGVMLSPMHIPVLISGYVLGAKYGLIVGIITPLLRSISFGMPALFPNAVGMAFELAAYGFLTGFLYKRMKKNNLSIIISLILSMLLGRCVWGIVSVFLWGIQGNTFTVQLFLANGFVNSIPGIILHVLLIPVVVSQLRKARIVE